MAISKPSSILQLTNRGLSDALRLVSHDAQGITESLKGAVNKVTNSVKVSNNAAHMHVVSKGLGKNLGLTVRVQGARSKSQ